jgi:hypothetical protein
MRTPVQRVSMYDSQSKRPPGCYWVHNTYSIGDNAHNSSISQAGLVKKLKEIRQSQKRKDAVYSSAVLLQWQLRGCHNLNSLPINLAEQRFLFGLPLLEIF